MKKIEFGTIIIDKLHQFFGKSDPSACVVVDVWSNEQDDGEDQEIWIEHYRGHFKKSYADLRDTEKWEILDKKIDTSKNAHDQLKKAEEDYIASQKPI